MHITLWQSRNPPRWWARRHWIIEAHNRFFCTCSYCRGFPHNSPPIAPMWKKFFTRPVARHGWRVFSFTCRDAHLYVRYTPIIWRIQRTRTEDTPSSSPPAGSEK